MLRLSRHLAVEELRECKQYFPSIPRSRVPLTCPILYGPSSYAIVSSWGVCSVFYTCLWSLAPWFYNDLMLGNWLWADKECGKHLVGLNLDKPTLLTIVHIISENTQCSDGRMTVGDSMFTSGRQMRKCSPFFTLPRAPNMKDRRENMVGLSK